MLLSFEVVAMGFESLPPLSLYIHLPWCVRKCPYCDFNSHAVGEVLPEESYVDALLRDLEFDLPRVWGRRLQSIFLGGGTPSLFSAQAMDRLLSGIRARIPVNAQAEITLEANPGTAEQACFHGYREAGINRLSIGVQSFHDAYLQQLGRIHRSDEAVNAVAMAKAAGFENINLDLMFALPGQTEASAQADVRQAMELAPTHISYYQLTLEPNTAFYHEPPQLPQEDAAWEIQQQGKALLAAAGFVQYETSAYAKAGRQCAHNLNYWQFGDYLGIGAGAHGKITDAAQQTVTRLAKRRNPKDYMAMAGEALCIQGERTLAPEDRVLEFMMNALRLTAGFPQALFQQHTGMPISALQDSLQLAQEKALLLVEGEIVRPTEKGQQFLNDLLGLFCP
jgi:putative oxygen-independent coproporphyrinogen III oxidase